MKDKLMEILKDKKSVIKEVLSIFNRSQSDYSALEKGIDILNKGTNQQTKDKMLKDLMTTTQRQAKDFSNLSAICLIYSQSQSFDSDVAMMLNKMGKGEEALQQMFKNKLNK